MWKAYPVRHVYSPLIRHKLENTTVCWLHCCFVCQLEQHWVLYIPLCCCKKQNHNLAWDQLFWLSIIQLPARLKRPRQHVKCDDAGNISSSLLRLWLLTTQKTSVGQDASPLLRCMKSYFETLDSGASLRAQWGYMCNNSIPSCSRKCWQECE